MDPMLLVKQSLFHLSRFIVGFIDQGLWMSMEAECSYIRIMDVNRGGVLIYNDCHNACHIRRICMLLYDCMCFMYACALVEFRSRQMNVTAKSVVI